QPPPSWSELAGLADLQHQLTHASQAGALADIAAAGRQFLCGRAAALLEIEPGQAITTIGQLVDMVIGRPFLEQQLSLFMQEAREIIERQFKAAARPGPTEPQ